jgi:hypothetical protein
LVFLQEQQGLQGLKEIKASKVQPEPQALQAQPERQALLAHKEHKASKVIRVLLEPRELLVLQGHRASKATQAHKGQQGPQVLQALLGHRVRLVLQALLAPELQQVVLLVNSSKRILQPITTLHGLTPLTEALTNHG